mmetsp:Transcript_6096/g.22007  ORF Transcript_6096/g.22007 Transcript_6096/m.22007 type:complete len:237 (-) Transcript_6096:797-1507(-)
MAMASCVGDGAAVVGAPSNARATADEDDAALICSWSARIMLSFSACTASSVACCAEVRFKFSIMTSRVSSSALRSRIVARNDAMDSLASRRSTLRFACAEATATGALSRSASSSSRNARISFSLCANPLFSDSFNASTSACNSSFSVRSALWASSPLWLNSIQSLSSASMVSLVVRSFFFNASRSCVMLNISSALSVARDSSLAFTAALTSSFFDIVANSRRAAIKSAAVDDDPCD